MEGWLTAKKRGRDDEAIERDGKLAKKRIRDKRRLGLLRKGISAKLHVQRSRKCHSKDNSQQRNLQKLGVHDEKHSRTNYAPSEYTVARKQQASHSQEEQIEILTSLHDFFKSQRTRIITPEVHKRSDASSELTDDSHFVGTFPKASRKVLFPKSRQRRNEVVPHHRPRPTTNQRRLESPYRSRQKEVENIKGSIDHKHKAFASQLIEIDFGKSANYLYEYSRRKPTVCRTATKFGIKHFKTDRSGSIVGKQTVRVGSETKCAVNECREADRCFDDLSSSPADNTSKGNTTHMCRSQHSIQGMVTKTLSNVGVGGISEGHDVVDTTQTKCGARDGDDHQNPWSPFGYEYTQEMTMPLKNNDENFANKESLSSSSVSSSDASLVLHLPAENTDSSQSTPNEHVEVNRGFQVHGIRQQPKSYDVSEEVSKSSERSKTNDKRDELNPLIDIEYWQRIVDSEEQKMKNCNRPTFRHTIASLVIAKNSIERKKRGRIPQFVGKHELGIPLRDDERVTEDGILWLPSILEGG